MNKAESERLGALLEQRGYQAAATPEKADLVILNTCVVRESAENRVINKLHILRRLKKQRPELTIAVTGCFVDAGRCSSEKEIPAGGLLFQSGRPAAVAGPCPGQRYTTAAPAGERVHTDNAGL